MRNVRVQRLLGVAATMIIVVCAVGAAGGGEAAVAGPGDSAAQEAKLAQSAALAATPAVDRGPLQTTHAAEDARVAASSRALALPLPADGNFNGVRWEQAGGTIGDAELQGILQYNAACQWLRAWRDGRESAVAAQVFAQVADWPALRETPAAAVLREAAADTAGASQQTAGLLADCQASHQREHEYATSLALTPSS